jgi:signal peptidase I
VGDFILVNKFTYGIRTAGDQYQKIIPISICHSVAMSWFSVIRKIRKLDYIKRVVGLPGDTMAYQNKRLTINGQSVRAG